MPKKIKRLAPGVCLVLTTTDKKAEARTLARGLVQEKLAACVSLMDIKASIYSWKGRLREGPEILLLIKTRSERVPLVKKWIASHHSFEIPEIIALPIADGHKPYLEWISRSVK